MRKLFQLVGELSIAGIDKVNQQFVQVDKEARKVQKSIALLGKNMEKTGKSLTKWVSAPLIGLGAAMVLAADKTGKYADKLLDLTEITGLSTDSLQEMEHVARIAGVDFGGLTNTIAKFTSKLPEIIRGTGYSTEAIKKLGVEIFDTDGHVRDMNDLFPEMIKKMQGMENVTERNAIAQQIFGRSLQDIAPVLGMTADEFDRTIQEAHDLNLIIGEEGIKTANEFRKEMEKLKAEFTKFWQRLAIDFIPTLKDTFIPLLRGTLLPIFEKISKTVKGVADWFNDLSDAQKKTALGVTAFLIVLGPFLMVLGNIVISTKALTSAVLLMNTAMLANPFVLAAAAIVAIGGGIYYTIKAWEDWKKSIGDDVAEKQTDALKNNLEEIIPLYGELVTAATSPIGEERFDEVNKRIKELETNLGDLGLTFEGNIGERALKAENILSDLAITVSELNDEIDRTPDSGATLEEIAAKAAAAKAAAEAEIDRLKTLKEKREQFEKEWTEKLWAEIATRKQILEEEKRIQLELAGDSAQTRADIEQYYSIAFARLEEEKTEKLAEETKKRLEIEKEYNESVSKADQEEADLIKAGLKIIEKTREQINNFYQNAGKTKLQLLRDERDAAITEAEKTGADVLAVKAYYAEQEQKLILDTTAQILGVVSGITGQMSAVVGQYYANKNAELDNSEQKEIKAIENSLLNEEEKDAALSAIDQKFAKERAKLKREQAKKDKAIAIFSAIINTATSVVKAFADWGFPLGIIFGAIMGALGIAQIALIASQPLPMKRGAFVKGGRGGVQAEIGEGTQDEIVLPMKTGVQALADALVTKLSEFKLPSVMTMPRLAMAGGGTMATGGGNRNSQLILHIGTLIADEGGIKELERRLEPYRISDQQRKGREDYGNR